MRELKKIDFAKYPVLSTKEKNPYVKSLKPLVVIYNSMTNCFDTLDIQWAFHEICNFLIEGMDKQILNGLSKIDNENSAKQYIFIKI